MSCYVGLKSGNRRETFSYRGYVTSATHGKVYNAIIGPFETRFAADLMAYFGANNIHMQSVFHAEQWARRLKGQYGISSLKQYCAWAKKHAIVGKTK